VYTDVDTCVYIGATAYVNDATDIGVGVVVHVYAVVTDEVVAVDIVVVCVDDVDYVVCVMVLVLMRVLVHI